MKLVGPFCIDSVPGKVKYSKIGNGKTDINPLILDKDFFKDY